VYLSAPNKTIFLTGLLPSEVSFNSTCCSY
jgi:hypothetical protein